jgi:hypothetical protein
MTAEKITITQEQFERAVTRVWDSIAPLDIPDQWSIFVEESERREPMTWFLILDETNRPCGTCATENEAKKFLGTVPGRIVKLVEVSDENA